MMGRGPPELEFQVEGIKIAKLRDWPLAPRPAVG